MNTKTKYKLQKENLTKWARLWCVKWCLTYKWLCPLGARWGTEGDQRVPFFRIFIRVGKDKHTQSGWLREGPYTFDAFMNNLDVGIVFAKHKATDALAWRETITAERVFHFQIKQISFCLPVSFSQKQLGMRWRTEGDFRVAHLFPALDFKSLRCSKCSKTKLLIYWMDGNGKTVT